MASFFDALDDSLREFIAAQKIFFTATAPHAGRINLSPKGMDTFRCLDNNTVAYLDLTGSGNETAAHLADDGRLTIMMCSFDAKPMILRLYGHGRTVQPRHAQWSDLVRHFDALPGMRQIIVMTIDSIQTSCGFAVPVMQLVEERHLLRQYAEKQGDERIHEHWRNRNQQSIDGLPTHLIED